ncbi:hypothetical protein BD779DRAFT_1532966 [Infundibulicybe gibba]|nr:hypothetical protein BD779DRAFT_1532966 [Infundibulicybe gibba]
MSPRHPQPCERPNHFNVITVFTITFSGTIDATPTVAPSASDAITSPTTAFTTGL